jgi:hypothetical protein
MFGHEQYQIKKGGVCAPGVLVPTALKHHPIVIFRFAVTAALNPTPAKQLYLFPYSNFVLTNFS